MRNSIFTTTNLLKGEISMRNLNDKAYEMYCRYSPLKIYEYEVDGEKLYSTKGCVEFTDVPFGILEDFFSDEYDEEYPEDDNYENELMDKYWE